MGKVYPSFPDEVWDGSTENRNRVGPCPVVSANDDDWDRIVAEVIAMQEFILSGGSGGLVVTDVNQSTTITSSGVYLVDGSGGNILITLPTAGTVIGQITVKKIDDSVNTVTIASAELIDGDSTKVIDTQYTAITVVPNDTTYHIV